MIIQTQLNKNEFYEAHCMLGKKRFQEAGSHLSAMREMHQSNQATVNVISQALGSGKVDGVQGISAFNWVSFTYE